MSYAKIAKVVDSLIINTELGKIIWKENLIDENTFKYSSANTSVIIGKKQHDYDEFSIFIEIYDKNGKQIEIVTDDDLSGFFDSSYQKMDNLFAVARRQALGVEQILDNLLEELPAVPENKSALKFVHTSQMSGMDDVPF